MHNKTVYLGYPSKEGNWFLLNLLENKKDPAITKIWKVYESLGGKKRPWHPYFSMNDLSNSALDIPNPRPEDKENSWNRPHLGNYTDNIGNAIEDYLEETYNMVRINDGPVDLRVTDGPFEGSPVQAKGAAVIVSQGQSSDGCWYSRPGGIYMREPSITQLIEENNDYGDDALLHTVVHYPQFAFEEETNVPIIEVNDGEEDGKEHVKTALIGELVMPVEKALETIEFNGGKRKACYWDWPKAYGERPNTSNIVEEWYEDTILTEKLNY